MSFNTPALLQAVDAILATVTGVQDSQIGVPVSFDARVSAYCCAGGQDFPDQLETMGGNAYGRLTRIASVFVGFAYATGATTAFPTDRAAIAQAELTLAGFIDDFIRKVLTDAPLKALCEDYRVDLSINAAPQYRDWGGREVRHWMCLVDCTQTEDI